MSSVGTDSRKFKIEGSGRMLEALAQATQDEIEEFDDGAVDGACCTTVFCSQASSAMEVDEGHPVAIADLDDTSNAPMEKDEEEDSSPADKKRSESVAHSKRFAFHCCELC